MVTRWRICSGKDLNELVYVYLIELLRWEQPVRYDQRNYFRQNVPGVLCAGAQRTLSKR